MPQQLQQQHQQQSDMYGMRQIVDTGGGGLQISSAPTHGQTTSKSMFILDQGEMPQKKTITNELIYILNDYTQNYPFCRIKLVVETFEHSTF